MNNFSDAKKKFLRQHLYNKGLSKCETEVVILVLQGLINKDVADILCIAEKTVKFHLTSAYKTLGISRRSEIVWTLPLAEFVKIDEQEKQQENNPSQQAAPQSEARQDSQEIFLPMGNRSDHNPEN